MGLAAEVLPSLLVFAAELFDFPHKQSAFGVGGGIGGELLGLVDEDIGEGFADVEIHDLVFTVGELVGKLEGAQLNGVLDMFVDFDGRGIGE